MVNPNQGVYPPSSEWMRPPAPSQQTYQQTIYSQQQFVGPPGTQPRPSAYVHPGNAVPGQMQPQQYAAMPQQQQMLASQQPPQVYISQQAGQSVVLQQSQQQTPTYIPVATNQQQAQQQQQTYQPTQPHVQQPQFQYQAVPVQYVSAIQAVPHIVQQPQQQQPSLQYQQQYMAAPMQPQGQAQLMAPVQPQQQQQSAESSIASQVPTAPVMIYSAAPGPVQMHQVMQQTQPLARRFSQQQVIQVPTVPGQSGQQLFTQPQLQQLRAQILAYKTLSKGTASSRRPQTRRSKARSCSPPTASRRSPQFPALQCSSQ